MELVLITGASNIGKSSLVRCLSGKGNDRHNHIHQVNILKLDWLITATTTTTKKTLVLNGSLNEGHLYNPQNRTYLDKGITCVHPTQLGQLLTDYESAGADKAILCISSSVRDSGWTVADYAIVIANGNISPHKLTHSIELGVPPTQARSFQGVATHAVSGQPRSPRNQIAATARPFINLA